MIEKRKICADADRFAECRAEPNAVFRAGVRAVPRAVVCADSCAEKKAQMQITLQKGLQILVQKEVVEYGKMPQASYYCVILIQ
jgi:hypothetical protein